MADIKPALHVLSPGDKSYPHCHSVITGRKSWKTLKGKTEAVWPPYLEVALFEGLSRYQPSNPRATKSLGRFPNRNRFISEYIHKKTGKHRTPKQVGSRLQQLRDTHQGKQLLQNLSNGNFSFEEGGASGSSTPTPSDPAPPYDYRDTPRTVVAIEILPDGVANYSPRSSPSNTPTSSPLSSTFPPSTFHHSQPRPISVIDPTVTFTSRSSMMAHSYFTVLRDGQPVHSETADVNLLSTAVDAGPSDIDCIFYYTAPLVPAFWGNICQDRDPARYSIIHDIYQHPGPTAEVSSVPEQGYLILSVEYCFRYPESPYPSPQLSPVDSLSSAEGSLPSPSSFTGYDYPTNYSPVPRHERLYPAQHGLVVPPDMCYPETHPLDGSYGQPPVFDGSPFLSALDGVKDLCAPESSQSLPAGYLNHHYVTP